MKRTILVSILVIAMLLTACDSDNSKQNVSKEVKVNGNNIEKSISRYPEYQDIEAMFRNKTLEELPTYNTETLRGRYIDVRSRDISHLNLKDRMEDLVQCQFDSKTKWPESLPQGFEPEKILSMNKTPGLNIKKLHEQGVTGENVGIGVVDYGLIINHEEYKDRLKFYDEVHYKTKQAHFHGPSIASILVGKNVGIAPGADLYLIGSENFDVEKNDMIANDSYFAESIYKLLEKNNTLPEARKIRVISISAAWSPVSRGYDEITKAVEEASKQGIFVVSANLFEQNPEFYFHGLDREMLDKPDDIESYTPYPGELWLNMIEHIDGFKDFYLKSYRANEKKKTLLIPIASRTVATAGGDSDYAIFRLGGWSFGIPYISGLYALCCQIDPAITPEKFWDAAYNTGETQNIEMDGKKETAVMINPVKLIEFIGE